MTNFCPDVKHYFKKLDVFFRNERNKSLKLLSCTLYNNVHLIYFIFLLMKFVFDNIELSN